MLLSRFLNDAVEMVVEFKAEVDGMTTTHRMSRLIIITILFSYFVYDSFAIIGFANSLNFLLASPSSIFSHFLHIV